MVGAMTDITDQKNNDDTVRRIKSRIAKIYARTRKLKFKIKNIAWTQSHVVRAPFSRILGIIN
jgi:hypothetical protein